MLPVPARPGLVSSVRQFFFAEETPYGLAVIRIILPLILIGLMLQRWIHVREFFSSDGAAAPLALNYGYFNFPPEPSGTMAVVLATALIVFLVTACLGWQTRVSIIASCVLYTYLNMLDCLGTFTKYSVIASHILLLLSFSHCGAVWSVDAWLTRTPGTPPPKYPAWPRRLIQLLIGIVYFGSAITKIHTPTFFSGDQLRFWMMTNVNHANPVGEELTLFPVMLVLSAYSAAVWEITFLFLAWRGHGRWIMLLMGIGFHAMTLLTLGLYVFPLICITTYLAFLNERDIQRWTARWRDRRALSQAEPAGRAISETWRQRVSWAFPLLLLVATVAGVLLEYGLDPYGKRRPEGPFSLVELDDATVSKMFNRNGVLRPDDLIHSLEIGTQIIGSYVTGHRSTFEQGERLYAQCTLNPPHPDMVVECNLRDGNNRLLDRVRQVVPRESLRANFLYVLHDALAPGNYALVVRCGGQEVVRRKITLTKAASPSRTPVAN